MKRPSNDLGISLGETRKIGLVYIEPWGRTDGFSVWRVADSGTAYCLAHAATYRLARQIAALIRKQSP